MDISTETSNIEAGRLRNYMQAIELQFFFLILLQEI